MGQYRLHTNAKAMFLLTPEAEEVATNLFVKALKHPEVAALFYREPKDEVLTIQGFAELMHCTPDTARDWAQSGKVPCFKPGKSYLFVKSEIIDWIKNNRKQALTN